MSEIIAGVVNAPIPTLFILAGVVFLFVAVAGNISGKIEPGPRGRALAGVIGVAFVVSGFAIYTASTPSSVPPLSEDVDGQPVRRDKEGPNTAREDSSVSESTRTAGSVESEYMRPTQKKQGSVSTMPAQTGAKTERNRSDTARPVDEDPFNWTAVIDDPDGYTNVRSMKSSSSEIVTKVYKNEEFYTYKQNGNWWQVRTSDGKLGYMHLSRIRVK